MMKGSYDIPVSTDVARRYNKWKIRIPLLYDWFINHNLLWPSLSCRWGPQIEKSSDKSYQRLYLSERTDSTAPNTLIVAKCEVVKPRVASQSISKFNEEERSPNLRKHKAIIHPGEVNKIREVPQNNNLVVTHTDSPEVLLWDIEAQPARHIIPGAVTSRPNLVLTGHTEIAEFALNICPAEPYVLSGGRDKRVVLWNINDEITSLSNVVRESPSVEPRGVFRGHTDTVEDVQFCPSNPYEFCSVGDDSNLILWDARVGTSPIHKVEIAEDTDVHCVDWNSHDINFILTGSADRSAQMFDRRVLNSSERPNPVHVFEGHQSAIQCVQWCPDKASVFGTSANDGVVNIWDYEKVGRAPEFSGRNNDNPPGLFFQHVGHRHKVVEFHWNPYDPWTLVTLSDDCRGPGGGTIQIWRMMDIIYGEEEVDIDELNAFRPCTVGRDIASLKKLSLSYY